MPLMTMKEYAAYRGVSQPSVSRAVSLGLCPVTLDPTGKRVIDSDEADKMWVTTGARNKTGNNGKSTFTEEEQKQIDEIKAKASPLIQSRSIKEDYQAKMAALDYEERIGRTLQADKVKEDGFKAARIVRDNLLNIPDRLAAELAGETNQFTIHKKLTDEIRRAISDCLRILTEEAENG